MDSCAGFCGGGRAAGEISTTEKEYAGLKALYEGGIDPNTFYIAPDADEQHWTANPLSVGTFLPDVKAKESELLAFMHRYGGDLDLAETLLRHDAEVNAVVRGHNDIARLLLKNGADISLLDKNTEFVGLFFDHGYGEGEDLEEMLLIAMSDRNKPGIVMRLLEEGADPTKRVDGRLPIDAAVQMGNTDRCTCGSILLKE